MEATNGSWSEAAVRPAGLATVPRTLNCSCRGSSRTSMATRRGSAAPTTRPATHSRRRGCGRTPWVSRAVIESIPFGTGRGWPRRETWLHARSTVLRILLGLGSPLCRVLHARVSRGGGVRHSDGREHNWWHGGPRRRHRRPACLHIRIRDRAISLIEFHARCRCFDDFGLRARVLEPRPLGRSVLGMTLA